jgi:2-keto-4-pentenoate hydratase/2-oxohepta-3-ene-1,7-dioic acid hydratase in catechol pathway
MRLNARHLVLVAMSLGSSVATAQMILDAPSEHPRVVRYISSLPAHRGQICYGVVLTASMGVPVRVRVLSDRNAQLCHGDGRGYSQPQLMSWAFAAADAVAANDASAHLEEELAQDRLAELVLPPVSISIAELAELKRVVIGAGLNYAEHSDEVGADDDELLIFPKAVAPTGPYAPISAGMQIGETPPRPVLLLDYEVELGFVLLEDVDLRNPPSSYDAFMARVAFFVANDVSDREPIIFDADNGYTRAKSRPTYLPIGPWMVHGKHLRPRTRTEGDRVLRLGLEVFETAPAAVKAQRRQSAGTDEMLRGPWAIVGQMSRTLQQGKIVCMRDAYGEPRFVHDANGVIPAGSIILTGTPGGTAVREPGLFDKASLFARGGFSVGRAKQVLVRDLEREIAATAYLQTGDRVEGWIEEWDANGGR